MVCRRSLKYNRTSFHLGDGRPHPDQKSQPVKKKKNYKIQYSLLFQLKRGDKARREPELLVRTSKTTYKGLIHAFDNFEPAAIFRQLVYSVNE